VLRVGVTLAGVAPAYEPMAYGALVIVAVALTVDRRSIGIVR
jgi:ribose transport system permease protein